MFPAFTIPRTARQYPNLVNVSPGNADNSANPSSACTGWAALLREPSRAPLVLAIVTFLFLAPFLTRAFNIDEPLFVWAGEQIQKHPLDPYGFNVNWYMTDKPMSIITKNPPLACYFIAFAGTFLGWNETALHLA